MSSPKTLNSKEHIEGEIIPLKSSLITSLVPYSSDSGNEDESCSVALSKECPVDANHNKNFDVYESDPKTCNELESSSLNSSPEKISCLDASLKTFTKESGLNSSENNSIAKASFCLKEIQRNEVGNPLKAFGTPTSIRKTEMFKKSPVTPLKRSFSVIENDDNEETGSHSPRTKVGENLKSLESPNRSQMFSRKSLPASYHTNDTQIQRKRKSYPLSNSSLESPARNQNFYSYRTDQTPYSPAQNTIHQQKRRRFNLPYYDAFGLMSLESESGFIDSHCHLDFIFQRQNYKGTFSEYQIEHENTFPKSYRGCVAIFCNPYTFSKKDMWGKFLEEDNVWASFGCHPHNAKDYNDYIEKSLYAALEHSKVRALGEIGLDYSNRNNCNRTVQFDVFRRQLRIALVKKLPVVIHCREAHSDAIEIIKEILPINYTIHLHCFTDTWEWAQKWLNEFPNLCIGITNVVTFPSAEAVHEVAKNIPLDRLLLETDAPYFIPKRGCQGMRWSHPGLAIHVAAQIAALKSIPIEQVFQSTRSNTKRIYNI